MISGTAMPRLARLAFAVKRANTPPPSTKGIHGL
jgi:hypothetical protein